LLFDVDFASESCLIVRVFSVFPLSCGSGRADLLLAICLSFRAWLMSNVHILVLQG
jgi:hypothetical protein